MVGEIFGEASDAAFTYGRTLAKTFGATLHLLHVTENVYLTAFGMEGYMGLMPNLQKQVETRILARPSKLHTHPAR